jgi:O-acetyl-ADP-ribose deacetylase (regulator of RNase III)
VVEHALRNGVKRIGMPRIGCGIGGLRWEDVRPLVERAARDVDIVAVEWAKGAKR